MVINLDDINIAITHNYVSPSNLGNVLKFFVEKQDQVSGCRDRKESIKPEHLYDELVPILKEKEPAHLEKALAQSGWTCRTWKDTTTTAPPPTSPTSVACKKRHLQDGSESERKNVMAKTDKVEAFAFSFL